VHNLQLCFKVKGGSLSLSLSLSLSFNSQECSVRRLWSRVEQSRHVGTTIVVCSCLVWLIVQIDLPLLKVNLVLFIFQKVGLYHRTALDRTDS
jgi:hypothetical protein